MEYMSAASTLVPIGLYASGCALSLLMSKAPHQRQKSCIVIPAKSGKSSMVS